MQNYTKNEIICFVAGHSGGHILPCITLSNRYANFLINFITTSKQLDSEILKNQNINKHLKLNLEKMPSKIWQFPIFGFNLGFSFFKSLIFLIFNRPQKIITTGGLVAIPVFLAGKFLRINLEIYELNVEPGKATKFLSKICKNIKICFSNTQRYFTSSKCELVSYPVRFIKADTIFNKLKIIKNLNFDLEKKTLLIVGGSQGSTFLNDLVKKLIESLELKNIQIIHQIGMNDLHSWQDFYKKYNVKNKVFTYNENIKDFYLISDLILCRSGAGTLAEIIFFEKKCITIPLETNTTNHQKLNALTLEKSYPNLIHVIQQNEVNKIVTTTKNLIY